MRDKNSRGEKQDWNSSYCSRGNNPRNMEIILPFVFSFMFQLVYHMVKHQNVNERR